MADIPLREILPWLAANSTISNSNTSAFAGGLTEAAENFSSGNRLHDRDSKPVRPICETEN